MAGAARCRGASHPAGLATAAGRAGDMAMPGTRRQPDKQGVPAPGLEPGQSQDQNLVGCQLPYAGLSLLSVIDGSGATPLTILGRAHCRPHPAFDLPVEVGAPHDVDAQATMVVVPYVLAHGPRVVRLDDRLAELRRVSAADSQPELLGRSHVSGLVDVDAEDQPFEPDSCLVEEALEESDQAGIAVDIGHTFAVSRRLALAAFAPIGNGASDEHLPVSQRAHLVGRGGPDRFTACLPGWALGLPVPARTLGRPRRATHVALPLRAGHVTRAV